MANRPHPVHPSATSFSSACFLDLFSSFPSSFFLSQESIGGQIDDNPSLPPSLGVINSNRGLTIVIPFMAHVTRGSGTRDTKHNSKTRRHRRGKVGVWGGG